MKSFNNLTVIGTSHISKQSIKEAEESIELLNPGIVALELDQARFYALLSKRKPKFNLSLVKEIGVKGFLFAILGAWVEKKLGKIVGTTPGDEMKAAARLALKKNLKIALIDQDLRITIRNLFKYLTWKEKWTFVKDLFLGFFGYSDVKQFDLAKVPEQKLIHEMVTVVRKKYPSFYKALIVERNIFMAKALYNLIENNRNVTVLALVGAGHEDEIISLIKKEAEKSYSNTQKKS